VAAPKRPRAPPIREHAAPRRRRLAARGGARGAGAETDEALAHDASL